jgi:Flp pilus assembly protein TadD
MAAEAEEVLAPVADLEPPSAILEALLGAAQFMNRRYLAAEETLQRALALGQRDLRTYYFLGSVLWENGNLEAAEKVCLQAIEVHGSQVPVAHLLGRLYLWQGRYEEASEWLGRAASQSSQSVDLWLDLAGALEGAGRLEEALRALERAVSLAPEHYQVRYGLARLLARSGDREAANDQLALYRELLEEDQRRTLEEGRLRARIERAYELLQQGDEEGAIRQLESLPLTVEVLVARAEVAQRVGDRQAALTALEQAVALDPSRGDLRSRLAAARLAEDSTE